MEMEPGDSELVIQLIEEIKSLGRERRDLLDSLTPSLSHWKQQQIHEGGEGESSQATTSTWKGRKDVLLEEESMSALQQEQQQQPYTAPWEDHEKELANMLDVLLNDMDGVGHRMLSTAYAVDKTRAPLHSYTADELVSRTSKLIQVSREFYNDAENHSSDQEEEEPEEQQGDDFLFLCRNYLRSPDDYKNELTLDLTAAEEEMEKEKNRSQREKEEAEAERWRNKTDKERDPSTMEFLKRRTDFHKIQFALHRACWERVWGSYDGRRGGFQDATTVSSMRFTHNTPDAWPSSAVALRGSTLQIYSIKLTKLKGNLNWPLKVHGLIAARDTLDHNRNILFSRLKHNYQVLTENDPFLRLTGPSRGILAMDPIDFEVELEIEGAGSRDRPSTKLHKSYNAKGSTSLFFRSPNCIVEISAGRLATPLQATIVGVRVVEGGWPFKRGCRVVCSSSSDAAAAEVTPREVVLLDYHGEDMRVGSGGYLHLSRNVVSVELQGTLRVVIQVYSRYGRQAHEVHVDFPVQQCQTSKSECFICNSKLEIVVAWSLLMKEKPDLLIDFPAC